jgi:hypothetical protein
MSQTPRRGKGGAEGREKERSASEGFFSTCPVKVWKGIFGNWACCYWGCGNVENEVLHIALEALCKKAAAFPEVFHTKEVYKNG